MPRVLGLDSRQRGFSGLKRRRPPPAEALQFAQSFQQDDEQATEHKSVETKQLPIVSQEANKETDDVRKAAVTPNDDVGDSTWKSNIRTRRRKKKRKSQSRNAAVLDTGQKASSPMQSSPVKKTESPRKKDRNDGMADDLEFSFVSPPLEEETARKRAKTTVKRRRDQSAVSSRTRAHTAGDRVLDLESSPVDALVGESRRMEADVKFKPDLKSTKKLAPRSRQKTPASTGEKSEKAQDVQWMDSVAVPHPSPDHDANAAETAASPAVSEASNRSHPKATKKDLSRVLDGLSEEVNSTSPQSRNHDQKKDELLPDSSDLDACPWLLSRKRYFERKASLGAYKFPVPVVEDSTDQKQRFASSVPLHHNQWDISLPLDSPLLDSVWSSESGRTMYWEAHVLNHIRNSLGLSFLRHIPKPVHLFTADATKGSANCAGLRLEAAADESDSRQEEMLGTLEDVMRLHCQYNTGPMPESTVAWLILQAIQIMGKLHECGVVHNDLGLDSFVLIRRRKQKSAIAEMLSDDDEEPTTEWFLQCIGFGEKSHIFTRKESNSDAGLEGELEGRDRRLCRHWHYENDLYSLANMAFVLLSGGNPMCWKHSSKGGYFLESESLIIGNQYLQGSLAWGELFSALLNPPSSRHGTHYMSLDRAIDSHTTGKQRGDSVTKGMDAVTCASSPLWGALSDSCTLLGILSEAGRQPRSKSMRFAPETSSEFFERLMAHAEHQTSKGSLLWNANPRTSLKLQHCPPHLRMQSANAVGASGKTTEDERERMCRMRYVDKAHGDQQEMKCDSQKDATSPAGLTMARKLLQYRERLRLEFLDKTRGLEEDHGRLLDENDDCHKAELERHRRTALEEKQAAQKREAELERRLQDMTESLNAERQRHQDELQTLKDRHQKDLEAKIEAEAFILRCNDTWQSINASLEKRMNEEVAKLEDERNRERRHNRVLEDSIKRFQYELKRRTETLEQQKLSLTQKNKKLIEEVQQKAFELSQLQQTRASVDVADANTRNHHDLDLGQRHDSKSRMTNPGPSKDRFRFQDAQSANDAKETPKNGFEEPDRFRGGHEYQDNDDARFSRDSSFAKSREDGSEAPRVGRNSGHAKEADGSLGSSWISRLSLLSGTSWSKSTPSHQTESIGPGRAQLSKKVSISSVPRASSSTFASSNVRGKLFIASPSDSDTDDSS